MTDDTPAGRVGAYLEVVARVHPASTVIDTEGKTWLAVADLRAVLAENQAMRDAIARVWQLDLRGIDHQWWIRDRDLHRVLHGDGVLDELAEQAHLQQPPHSQRAPLHPSVECMDQLCPQHEAEREQEADLRAARDMLRKTESPDA
jgi:hypothetical protein